ncbi:hypothetical protein [Streptomyces aureus]|uniref:hypothetical protein n=1 Tax=Streptomyces aureus TaxID=193461 RepID=UPI003630CDFC
MRGGLLRIRLVPGPLVFELSITASGQAEGCAVSTAAAVHKERGEILAARKDGKASLKEVLERDDALAGRDGCGQWGHLRAGRDELGQEFVLLGLEVVGPGQQHPGEPTVLSSA